MQALTPSSKVSIAEIASKLAKANIDQERFKTQELQEDLQRLWNQWKELSDNQEASEDVEAHMALISQKAEGLKQELALLPQYNVIRVMADQDKDLLRAHLAKLMLNIVKFLNLKESLNVEQINEISLTIIEECKGLTLEDIAVCFHKAKKGYYGIIYRLDGSVILQWLEKYKEERRQKIAKEQQSLHIRSKASAHGKRSASMRIIERESGKMKFN